MSQTNDIISQTSVLDEEQQPPRATRFKNRSRMEIVATLLEIGRTGALKTHLMYKANLSYVIVSQYIDFLTGAELMKESFDDLTLSKMYQTTREGLKYLEVYDSLQTILLINGKREIHSKSSFDLFG